MTACEMLGLALLFTGFWALCATLHLIDLRAEVKKLSTEGGDS